MNEVKDINNEYEANSARNQPKKKECPMGDVPE
jgi:hypothetical protein